MQLGFKNNHTTGTVTIKGGTGYYSIDVNLIIRDYTKSEMATRTLANNLAYDIVSAIEKNKISMTRASRMHLSSDKRAEDVKLIFENIINKKRKIPRN